MATGRLVFFLLLIAFLITTVNAALQGYIPAINGAGLDRDEIIERYFNLGLQHHEIINFLSVAHGIIISLRQLKRVLKKRQLKRSTRQVDLGRVISAIESELERGANGIGYRAMWQRLRNEHKIVVSREIVRQALRIIDPEGVAQRLRHRLRRRQYRAKGPNFLWHIDGYDKLKPYGFCIHGCIDGFSRRIMWLEVGTTNNDSRVVAKYFLDCVKQIGGMPSIVRADYGTENVKIAGVQRFLRRHGSDSFAGTKCFMYGRSVSNQRIESWWSLLRKSCTDWWISHFKDLRDFGSYSDHNILHVECLKFCYMPVIRNELQRVAIHWNTHRIRPSTNPNSPSGRPDTLYFVPSLTSPDCKNISDDNEIAIAEQHCCRDIPPDCMPSFMRLAQILMGELGLQSPNSPEAAKDLYLKLTSAIENI